MKVIICGAGRVGYGIAKELAAEKNAVTVIDTSAKLIDQVASTLDVRGVVGHGAHPDVLDRAGAADAEMIIAVTVADEINMVSCQVAHSIFQVPTKIARVRSRAYLDPAWGNLFSRNNLPIDVIISPEIEVGRAILRRLETPGAFDTLSFAEGRVLVLGLSIEPACPVIATPLNQLAELFPHLRGGVVSIRRERRLFATSPTDQLMPGDEAYLIVDADHAVRALDIFGRVQSRARKIAIVGGGSIGIYVAQALERTSGVRVRMIEADKRQAEIAADALRKTVVLFGDGLDRALLREAGAADAEVVVSLTNDDKVNVLSAALAKQEGARSAVCLINDRTYDNIKDALGIEVFVDPRQATVSTILQHVRKGRITGLQSVGDGDGEFLEGEVLDTSPLSGKPLKKAVLGDGMTIGAIVRGGEVRLPEEDLVIQTGDRIIIFAERAAVSQVEKLFRVTLEFF